ncbi:MAG: carboxypeptidase regulatory-like domain-containing protein [Phycisphaerae bacterium]
MWSVSALVVCLLAAGPGEGRQVAATRNVRGVVCDEAGKPVAGARVSLMPGAGPEEIRTDAEGKFEAPDYGLFADRSDVPYVLLVRHEKRSLAAAVDVGDRSKALRVTVVPAVTVKGRVTDPEDKPVQKALIYLHLMTGRWGHGLNRGTAVDANGCYEVPAVPVGREYSVRASADGYGEDRAKLEVPSGSSGVVTASTIMLRRADRSLSGLVVDQKGKPVADALINVLGKGQRPRVAHTDKDGKFSVDGVIDAAVRVTAYAKDRSAYGRAEARGGDKDVKIVLRDRGVFSSIMVVPQEPPSLVGKPLGKLDEMGLKPPLAGAEGKRVLVCFWDMEQRPSRHCLRPLAARSDELAGKGVVIACVHASAVDRTQVTAWLEENKVAVPAGMVPDEKDKTPQERARHRWGVRALPWLILTDEKHTVRAEGFALRELDHRLKSPGQSKHPTRPAPPRLYRY